MKVNDKVNKMIPKLLSLVFVSLNVVNQDDNLIFYGTFKIIKYHKNQSDVFIVIR